MATLTNKTSLTSKMTNPTVRKLEKYCTNAYEGEVSSYKGIAARTVFYLIIMAAGVGAYFYLHQAYGDTENGAKMKVLVLLGALVVSLVSGLIASFAPRTCVVSGTIYSAAMGYLLTFISMSYAQQYKGIVMEAIILTILTVAAMAFLYSTGKVRVTDKFRTILCTLLIVSILGGIVFALLSTLAPSSSITKAIISVNNGPLGIVIAIGGVVLAALFLLCDFDTIQQTVERGLPKKYEWYAAYGLVAGVIYLYLKILQLLARLQSENN